MNNVAHSVGADSNPPPKNEWIWNENQSGYEGVHLREGVVLWFEHRHNPFEGGAARSQSFEDILENGPACPLPTEILDELIDAVKVLASQKGK